MFLLIIANTKTLSLQFILIVPPNIHYRQASDVSLTVDESEEPSLELTASSLGGITSTQTITDTIENKETPPQPTKALLPSVDNNTLEEANSEKNDDLRTRSSLTRFANKKLLSKPSGVEAKNALHPGFSRFFLL